MASNAELISRWSTVTEPLDALRELVEHARDFGYDPYYGELYDAIWAMADRINEQIVDSQSPLLQPQVKDVERGY